MHLAQSSFCWFCDVTANTYDTGSMQFHIKIKNEFLDGPYRDFGL